MLTITKDKDVKAFVSFFDRINQQFKNRIKSKDNPRQSEYTIRQGRIYSFDKDLLSNVVSEIVYQKKEQFFKDEFNKLNLNISGLVYYTFMSANKKYVNEVVLDEEHGITFKTSIPEVELIISATNSTEDIKLYKESKNSGLLSHIKPINEFDRLSLNDDIVMDILNSDGAYVILVNEIKLRITHKVLFGITVNSKSKKVNGESITTKTTSKVDIIIYETNAEDVYAVKVIVDNTEMKSPMKIANYFAVLNY